MKAGKTKKIILLVMCVIISITIIYTAIFHTLPFVFKTFVEQQKAVTLPKQCFQTVSSSSAEQKQAI